MAREENDFYPTPDDLAVAITQRVGLMVPPKTIDSLIEPSAGSGAFVRPMRAFWSQHQITAIDIEPHEPALVAAGASSIIQADWKEWISKAYVPNPVLVLGNPPFSVAEDHIRVGLDYLPPTSHIVFLLKLNFIGGTDRAEHFWRLQQLKWIVPIAGRPSFVKGKKAMNDTNEYGVFFWEVGYAGPPLLALPHIFWKKKRGKK
jgi:hypothetical protein